MENKLLNQVREMHTKFNLQNTDGPMNLSNEEKAFRVAAMREEITEYEESTDLVSEYDSLIDLLVFTVGTFERQGFPLQLGFDAVMAANINKELGQNGNKRGGFKRDLVKPAGWVGPEGELTEILAAELQASSTSNEFDKDGFTHSEPDGDSLVSLKFDEGKVPLDLLPVEPLAQIAQVLGFGVDKYGRDNWRTGKAPDWHRCYASLQRHLTAWWSGQENDPESGMSHLAHAGCVILFLMYYKQFGMGKDTRFVKG